MWWEGGDTLQTIRWKGEGVYIEERNNDVADAKVLNSSGFFCMGMCAVHI